MSLNASFPMPRSQTPVIAGGLMDKDWFRFLVSVYNAVTQGLPQPEVLIAVGASPFIYPAVIRGQIHIGGGTVSAIEFSRNGTTWYDTGLVKGFVEMDARDQLRITYSVAPTLTFFPM